MVRSYISHSGGWLSICDTFWTSFPIQVENGHLRALYHKSPALEKKWQMTAGHNKHMWLWRETSSEIWMKKERFQYVVGAKPSSFILRLPWLKVSIMCCPCEPWLVQTANLALCTTIPQSIAPPKMPVLHLLKDMESILSAAFPNLSLWQLLLFSQITYSKC